MVQSPIWVPWVSNLEGKKGPERQGRDFSRDTSSLRIHGIYVHTGNQKALVLLVLDDRSGDLRDRSKLEVIYGKLSSLWDIAGLNGILTSFITPGLVSFATVV